MVNIGSTRAQLDPSAGDFSIEAFSQILPASWIDDALAASGVAAGRIRDLPPKFMTWFVVLMGVYRRVSYRNLLEKIRHSPWLVRLWPGNKTPTSSAVTQARDRLGSAVLRLLFRRSAVEWLAGSTGTYFHGHRVHAIDGMTLKTSDSDSNRNFFGLPGSSRGEAGYPQMRTLGLLDVGTHLLHGIRWGPYSTGEVTLFKDLLSEVERDSVVLLDRNFLAFEPLWALHNNHGAHFVVRAKKNVKGRVVRQLGPGDAIVELSLRSARKRAEIKLPETWLLRELTFTPEGWTEPLRVFTTLLNTPPLSGIEAPTKIPAQQIAELYFQRWGHEGANDEFKTHMCDLATVNRPVVFRSERKDRVEQELYGLLLAYNLIRMLMTKATDNAPDQPSPIRLSFVAALERTREAVRDMMRIPARLLAKHFQGVLAAIARQRVPHRPGRNNPRAVKIKMSKYPVKRREAG